MMKLRTVFLCLSGLVAISQPAMAQGPSRGWLDVNFISVSTGQDEQEYLAVGLSTEGVPFGMGTTYPALSQANGVGIEGGFIASRGLGFGLRFGQVRYDQTAGLVIAASHPVFFDLIAIDTGESQVLQRTDRSIDLMATWQVPLRNADVQLRVFGGPTYFNVSQDMVANIQFSRLFNLNGTVNTVSIVSTLNEEVSGSAWGYNLGTDVGYFFTRHVGVGGGVQFNKGTVDIEIPLLNAEDPDTELEAGKVTLAVGLRLRF